MSDDEQRDPLERLRAADPADGVEARDGFADEVVARATVDSDQALAGSVADLTAERARRRPAWMQVAAAAAALVVVGAVGYGVGAAAGGGTNLAEGAAPPISLQGPSDAATTEGGALPESATGDMMMVPEPGPFGRMTYPAFGGHNSFSASGLATAAGTAAGYAFDARAASNAEAVGALAAAFGVEGEPELANGAWNVGSADGSGPALGVSVDGTMGFWYSDPRNSPWQCADGAETCEPTGEIPSEDAAIGALRELLEAAGRDSSDYEYASDTWEGAVTRTAQAWPVVDGQRIDQTWTLELSDRGTVSASGALAGLVALGDYPVVSEQEGFERLSDPRFSAIMTALPVPMRDAPVTTEEWVPPTEPPAVPEPGESVSWPVNDVEIVEARMGLASQWQPDGSVLVVPAYEFTDADGGTWSVIAVAESKLDFAAE